MAGNKSAWHRMEGEAGQIPEEGTVVTHKSDQHPGKRGDEVVRT